MDFQHEQDYLMRTFPSPPGNHLKDIIKRKKETETETKQEHKQTKTLHTMFNETRRQI